MFDQTSADIACNFFEKVLKNTTDEWWGKPFLLAPWQEEALTTIFGNIDDEGRRLIEMAYLEVPKKAGKSEFAAGIILLLLMLETTPGCQIYGAASAKGQARNVYRAAVKMVEQSEYLRSKLRILRGTDRILKYDDPESFYAIVGGDGDLSDGVNPLATVIDEIHRWKTRKQIDNYDVLTNGGMTRRQTLTIAITTAGIQYESPLAWRLHEKTLKIQRGIIEDPKFYGRIYGADKDDDPASEKTWIKANPSLKQNGGFLDISKVRAQWVRHQSEGDLTSFKRYHLNMWDQKENMAIDMTQWDASSGDWESRGLLADPGPIDIDGEKIERKCRPMPDDFMARFLNRRCFAGVDLAATTDLTAVVFLFPCEEPDTYDVLPFFWLPDKHIRKFEAKLGVPLQKWAEDGFLELCEGEVIDYRKMQARLEWGGEMFELREIALDRWNSRQMSIGMIDDGYACVEIPQGYGTLNEPTKKLLECVIKGTLHHGGHPVLRWHASCAAEKSEGDNKMFVKPDRAKSSQRIDGIAATVNALARHINDTNAEPVAAWI